MPKFDRTIRDNTFAWPEDYYLETDAKKREALLKAQLEKDNSEANQIRFLLWKKRYTIPGKGITGADYYMRMLLNLEIICERKKSFFGKKRFQKGIEEIRDVFCLDQLKEKPELADLWEKEFVNLWRLYITCCKEDSNYGGIILGVGRMSDNRLAGKIENDIEMKTGTIPEELGLSEELTQFRQAAWEAYHLMM